MPHLLPGTNICFFRNKNRLQQEKKAMLECGKQTYQINTPFM
jgi:hypothetical protein